MFALDLSVFRREIWRTGWSLPFRRSPRSASSPALVWPVNWGRGSHWSPRSCIRTSGATHHAGRISGGFGRHPGEHRRPDLRLADRFHHRRHAGPAAPGHPDARGRVGHVQFHGEACRGQQREFPRAFYRTAAVPPVPQLDRHRRAYLVRRRRFDHLFAGIRRSARHDRRRLGRPMRSCTVTWD